MAITGAGGGILSVPLLVFVLHLQMLEASPIGLLAVTISSGVGALIALRAGNLRYRAAILLAGAGPIGLTALELAQRLAEEIRSSINQT